MKIKCSQFGRFALVILAAAFACDQRTSAQGPPAIIGNEVSGLITYQGRLMDGDVPMCGNTTNPIHLRVGGIALPIGVIIPTNILADMPDPTNYFGGYVTNLIYPDQNGFFTTYIPAVGCWRTNPPWWQLSFSNNLYLEFAVRTNATQAFSPLEPMQRIFPAPMAAVAQAVSGPVPASQIVGTIGPAQLGGIYSNQVTFIDPTNWFAGNGSGLTSLNANNLLGTVPDTALSTNVVLRGTDARLGNVTVGGLVTPGDVDAHNAWVTGNVTVGGTLVANSEENYGTTHLIGPVKAEATVSGPYLIGGSNNVVTGLFSSILAGSDNIAASGYSVVCGGQGNDPGPFSFVVGGQGNKCDGSWSGIGGGLGNTIAPDANYATIPGGFSNYVSGTYVMAAGQRAKATNDGAFVWADSTAADFASLAGNTFNVRAQNGVRIQSDTAIHMNAADRPIIVRDWDVFNSNVPNGKANIGRWGLFMEPANLVLGIANYNGAEVCIANYMPDGTRTNLMVVDNGGNVWAKSFNPTSDRNAKENFLPVNTQDVLVKVSQMPISEWNFKGDTGNAPHIGPMAQDFRAAFGLGADDTHIATVDADGVALAAIQGLNQKLDEQLRAKDAKVQSLEKRLAILEARLNELETK